MAIKIDGQTVITDGRKGKFRSVNPGSYTTANRPNASAGDIIYDSDEQNIFIYNGTEWVSTGGGLVNNLNPAIPPFISTTGPATNLSNSDGKVQFSLDGNSYVSNLSVPAETVYYCDWTSDINNAAHDSSYETTIGVTYPNVGASQTIELDIKVDRLPDPFSFTAQNNVVTNIILTSNTVSPLNSINVPTAIWGSTDADSAEIAIADGAWEALPTSLGSRYIGMNERVRVRHICPNPGSTYTTTLNIGYGTNSDQHESADFVTVTQAAYVDPPTITTPTQNGFVDQNGITVETAAPTGLDFGNHNATSWQISKASDFSTIYAESLNDTTNLRSWTANVATETEGETYYIRAKYYTDIGFESAWSSTRTSVGQKWYTWRLYIRTNAGRGGGSRNAGGDGGKVNHYLVTTSTSRNVPNGSISQNQSFSSGGTGGDGAGNGAGATATTLDSTRVSVAAGGGGGSGCASGNGGAARSDPMDGSSTPNANNGQNGTFAISNGGGGGGGVAGNAGGSCGAGQGGMNYALPQNSTIGVWTVESVSQQNNSTSSNCYVNVERRYKNGSWTSIGNQGQNYNGSISALVP